MSIQDSDGNQKEMVIPTISDTTSANADVQQLDPVLVKKLRWKIDLTLLPLLVIMYTFKWVREVVVFRLRADTFDQFSRSQQSWKREDGRH